MNNPSIALKKLRQLLDDVASNDSATAWTASYAAAIAIIGQLENDSHETGYIAEKLGTIRWHINAMFKADEDNGKSQSQHLIWAQTEITAIESSDGLKAWAEKH